MTFRTATIATLSIFTFACADEGSQDFDSLDQRAELRTDLDGIGNSTDGDVPEEEAPVITQDDVPRLVQGLMQDIYDSEDDCIPGSTILGFFADDTVSGKALDTTWRTSATFEGDIDETGAWTADWTGVSDVEFDPNDPVEPEVETGELEGLIDAETESFSGAIHITDDLSMDIEGYWVYETETSGFFFGVAWDCE